MDSEACAVQLPSISKAETDSESSECALVSKDRVPEQVHQLYFVKLHPYENPYLIKAENLIQKLNQERLQIHQTRDEKLMYRDKLPQRSKHTHYYYPVRNWTRDSFKSLQLSLDKLTFANNSSRGRAIKPSSTVKEIDKHSLHFGLLHGNQSLGEEGRILRKIKEAEEIPEDTSVRDCDDKIRKLSRRMHWGLNIKADEKEQIFREIEKIERARAAAIESATAIAALNGKMWQSLGSKEDIIQQIKTIGDELDKERAAHLNSKRKAVLLEKEREAVENDLVRLENRLTHTGRLKNEAAECISKWRIEHREKNFSYNNYVELMMNARELAQRKELSAVQKLSSDEVEKFMWQWNNNKAFRDEYRRRTAESLNKRSLTIDGRRRDRDEKPIFVNDRSIKISKRLNKALHEV
ncbi:proton pump-interactor BIP131-like [Punica granatum]|uniref:Proton pump-interactor BIP131-like n=1 Tax=Punica granatum TaxID=22663 RepID=A0A6P8DJ00_PUNGR|nr:proton pump-interactor BIP131-like [Punica granatum]